MNGDSRFLLLTFSELYLVKNEIDPDCNDGMFKIEGVLGLEEDRQLKYTPCMQLVKVLYDFESNKSKHKKEKKGEMKIVAHLYLLNSGVLDLYYLMKETDNLMYFRL